MAQMYEYSFYLSIHRLVERNTHGIKEVSLQSCLFNLSCFGNTFTRIDLALF